MSHSNNIRWKETDNRRNKTTKSVNNYNAQRRGNLEVLGNIRSGHDQTSGDERKNKTVSQTRKLLESKLFSGNLIKVINTWATPLVR